MFSVSLCHGLELDPQIRGTGSYNGGGDHAATDSRPAHDRDMAAPRGTSFPLPIIRPQARPLGNRRAPPLIAKQSRTNGFYSLDYWVIASPDKSEGAPPGCQP